MYVSSLIILTFLDGGKLMMDSNLFLWTAFDALLLELHPINIRKIATKTQKNPLIYVKT